MIERNLGLHPQPAPVGTQLAEGLAKGSPHRLEYADVATRLVERPDSNLVDGCHERRRAAVHDGHLRPVDLDHRIVDAEPAQRRQHMLSGGHQGP